jgi:hypothetical protein
VPFERPIDHLRHLPPEDWRRLGLMLGTLIVGILLIQAYRHSKSQTFVNIILFTITCIVFLHWVYDRDEPKPLTPLIDWVAPLLPSKDTIAHF